MSVMLSRTGKEILKHAALGTMTEYAHLKDDKIAVCAIQLPRAC